MKDKYGNYTDPHFGMRFSCLHCENKIQICNSCNGYGYYYTDITGKRERTDCTKCDKKGVHHV